MNIKAVATEIASALQKEIPSESVRVISRDKSAEEKIRTLRVAIRLDDDTVLAFTNGCGWREYDAKNHMLLAFSNSKYTYTLDICDYKTIAEQFICFYKNYKNYCEELQPLLYESEKAEKIRQTARTTIRTLIPKLMAQTDYEWNLVEEDNRSVLQVKMKRAKMLEITLGHKSFTDKIPDLLNVIKQMDSLISEMPYPVNIQNYGRNIPWKKGDQT